MEKEPHERDLVNLERRVCDARLGPIMHFNTLYSRRSDGRSRGRGTGPYLDNVYSMYVLLTIGNYVITGRDGIRICTCSCYRTE